MKKYNILLILLVLISCDAKEEETPFKNKILTDVDNLDSTKFNFILDQVFLDVKTYLPDRSNYLIELSIFKSLKEHDQELSLEALNKLIKGFNAENQRRIYSYVSKIRKEKYIAIKFDENKCLVTNDATLGLLVIKSSLIYLGHIHQQESDIFYIENSVDIDMGDGSIHVLSKDSLHRVVDFKKVIWTK